MKGAIQEIQILLTLLIVATLGLFIYYGMTGSFFELLTSATEVFSNYINANHIYMKGMQTLGLRKSERLLQNYASCPFHFANYTFGTFYIFVYDPWNDEIESIDGSIATKDIFSICPSFIYRPIRMLNNYAKGKYRIPPKGKYTVKEYLMIDYPITISYYILPFYDEKENIPKYLISIKVNYLDTEAEALLAGLIKMTYRDFIREVYEEAIKWGS